MRGQLGVKQEYKGTARSKTKNTRGQLAVNKNTRGATRSKTRIREDS